MTVRALHRQREDVRGLVINCRYYEPLKSWCNRMSSWRWREPRVSTLGASRLAFQQRLKRRPPSGRKAFGPQRALQSIAGMIRRIKECVDLCDRHSLVRVSHLHDLVTGSHFAFLQDAEVEPGPSAACPQCRHPALV